MVSVTEAVAAREERLQTVLTQQQEFDAKKKSFADEVAAVAEKVAAEAAEVDALAKGAGTVTDEPESIAKGKEVLEGLQALTSNANRDRRQALITPAQELNDWLVDKGELDNPYSEYGVATLKSQVEVLEKDLRDKITFLEGQITRAQVRLNPNPNPNPNPNHPSPSPSPNPKPYPNPDPNPHPHRNQADISPEQKEEIMKNFSKFDKSGDGTLTQAEFSAVLKKPDL